MQCRAVLKVKALIVLKTMVGFRVVCFIEPPLLLAGRVRLCFRPSPRAHAQPRCYSGSSRGAAELAGDEAGHWIATLRLCNAH